ncbi:E3 SUMO-protein ligase ZBED1-like [Halictus rubicundus]|uniref:E3 SUMO-protein ligase ZBED1-like n=1 Tax=Halictus rubicundus TaxID=77578 RepID=UPI0040356430
MKRKVKCSLEDSPVREMPNLKCTYISEPQLRFDLDPYEWWKARTHKYPRISKIAKKYLTMPATSAMSERCFSSAGNIVTAKRNRLLPENVNTLVFLHQNKQLID